MVDGGGGGSLSKAVTALLVPLPSVLFYLSFLGHHNSDSSSSSTQLLWTWCFHHPLLLANALFFLNVDFLFWIIALLQSTHWMIDLYWTIIPVLLVHYYAIHPSSHYDAWRSRAVILLTWAWSMRLAHNYFRREKWQWGAREDWRFTDMQRQYGKHWWWASFFAVYVSQQAVHSVEKPLNAWDFIVAASCCCGIVIAYHADTQLHSFVSRNEQLKERGEATVPTLDRGLWRFSRHPNYFGEQLWWWGLGVLGWSLGQGWTVAGTVVNSLCLAYVTKLVEERMMKDDCRAEAYRLYQKTTSVWVPWSKFSTSSVGKDKSA